MSVNRILRGHRSPSATPPLLPAAAVAVAVAVTTAAAAAAAKEERPARCRNLNAVRDVTQLSETAKAREIKRIEEARLSP